MNIDIKNIIPIAKKAGEEILKIYNKDFNVEYKKSGIYGPRSELMNDLICHLGQG